MKRQPMEMTPDQIRDRIERAEGRVDLYVEVSLYDLPLKEFRSFIKEIRNHRVNVDYTKGKPELRIGQRVIRKENPHIIRITGEKPRLRP